MRKLFANFALAIALGAVVPAISTPSHAQLVHAVDAPPDAPIDDAARKAAVQGLARLLRQRYVFPDVGARYASALEKKLAGGGYRATPAAALGEAINADLQAVQKDKHLRVRFDPSFRPR